ncbi:MAG: pilus assembly protein PilM [Lentisphaeria bacterium]
MLDLWNRTKRYVGLDIGNYAVRAVLFERGKALAFEEWCIEDEGVLDDSEVYDGLHKWLQKLKWDNVPIVVGLPQFICSTQIKDFPVGNAKHLKEMVAFETTQLAGISEDSFMHSYCRLSADTHYKNPVLIGICRKNFIETHFDLLSQMDCPVMGMAMHGLSLVNVLAKSYPQYYSRKTPVLILDIGKENSTIIIVVNKKPVFISTLAFSGNRFTDALAAYNKQWCKHGESLKLADILFDNESLHSPLLEAAKSLDIEIQNVVEHWRSQDDAYADVPIGHVFFSGGGMRIGDLVHWLQVHMDVPVKLLGPTIQGRIMPEFAVAYGLGIQAAGLGVCSLSFLSEKIIQRQRKVFQFVLLAVSCLFFCLSLLGSEMLFWHKQSKQILVCRAEIKRMGGRSDFLPKLQSLYSLLKKHERKMMPKIAGGKKIVGILAGLEQLESHLCEDELCVYFADYDSFKVPVDKKGDSNSTNLFGEGGSSDVFFQKDKSALSREKEFPNRIYDYSESFVSQNWIIAGFVPFEPAAPYQRVKDLVGKLKHNDLFEQVDLLPEKECIGREDVFIPWGQFLKKKSQKEFKPFTLSVPKDLTKNNDDSEEK